MIDPILQKQLEPLARDRQRWHLWRALAACWAVAALAGLLFVLIYWSTGWQAPWIFLLLIIASLIGMAAVYVRFEAFAPDYRKLARQIELENPQLHALLLTAVEQQPDSRGELNYLQQRVIEEALRHYRRSSWSEDTDRKLYVIKLAHWMALFAFLVCLFVLRPRSIRPGELWATAAHSSGVTVTPGDTALERGSGLVVLAKFGGKIPTDATLVVQPINENERRLPLTKNLADPVFGGGLPEIKGDLTYRVEFPEGKTRDFKVTVFDYPKLDHADVKITYPAFTAQPEKSVPDTRRVSAVEGSTIDYAFFLNKPVKTAQWVAKDKTVIPLAVDTNNATIRHVHFTLEENRRYELVLVDDAGRTNRLPPEFILDALKNRPAELKLSTPRGDQRVSALAEISFSGVVSDDFGLRAYGIAYTLGDGQTKTIELGQTTKPSEQRSFNYLLPLESLGAKPDEFLSYYIWADDLGNDGQVRRTSGDMFFAEIKPFDEIFREQQSPGGNEEQNNNGGQQGNQAEKLSELQKQIISATWNLKRRETAAKPSAKYKEDVSVIRDSQQQALEQLKTLQERIQDARVKSFAEAAQKEMEKADKELTTAADKNDRVPLASALTAEQAASQALLKLAAREYQVARNNRNQRGSRSNNRNQEQLDQLDLKQAENRYENQRDAATPQKQEQREQLQVANRLKELAQRQEDLNTRLKELQTALQEAKNEQERDAIRDRLKRLSEEQQEMLADMDELRQRMDRPENQSRMSDARQQLDQTRSQVEQEKEALDQQSVPRALTAGTRAQEQLRQMEQDFRKQNSGQFTEDMRNMRNNARQLAQDQEQISKKLDGLNDQKQKTLSDSDERTALSTQLEKQKAGVTNLLNEMRQVSEQSETAEPLLSRQLYDMVRQTNPEELDKSLDLSSELIQRGFLPQATQFEQRARQNIDKLKQGVEHAAESVLGDDVQALRIAKRELDELTQKLDEELAAAGGGTNTNSTASGLAASGQPSTNRNTAAQSANARNGSPNAGQDQTAPQTAQQQNASGNQRGNQQGNQPGEQPGSQPGNRGRGRQSLSSQPNQTASSEQNGQGQAGGNRAAQRNGNRNGGGGAVSGNNGGSDGGQAGPLAGEDYVDWSDRLRDVEEMIDVPDLRSEVARIRDRGRAIRLDYKRLGKKPDWAVVRTQISTPLAEVRSRVAEELARRESKDALVPLDRDPVPAKYSELVRRYYEQLGKSE